MKFRIISVARLSDRERQVWQESQPSIGSTVTRRAVIRAGTGTVILSACPGLLIPAPAFALSKVQLAMYALRSLQVLKNVVEVAEVCKAMVSLFNPGPRPDFRPIQVIILNDQEEIEDQDTANFEIDGGTRIDVEASGTPTEEGTKSFGCHTQINSMSARFRVIPA